MTQAEALIQSINEYLSQLMEDPSGMTVQSATLTIDADAGLKIREVCFRASAALPANGGPSSTDNPQGDDQRKNWVNVRSSRVDAKPKAKRKRKASSLIADTLPPKPAPVNKSIRRSYTTAKADIAAIRFFFSKWRLLRGFMTENQSTAIASTMGIRYENLTDVQKDQILSIFNDLRKNLGYGPDGKVIKT